MRKPSRLVAAAMYGISSPSISAGTVSRSVHSTGTLTVMVPVSSVTLSYSLYVAGPDASVSTSSSTSSASETARVSGSSPLISPASTSDVSQRNTSTAMGCPGPAVRNTSHSP